MERVNKKGQQMTLGTIIAIVLGILVLVFLIFGFTTGWNNMWEKITNLGGGSSNVDTIVTSCEIACTSNSVNAYCNEKKTMRFGEERTIDGINMKKIEGVSCENFADDFPNLGVETCGTLCD